LQALGGYIGMAKKAKSEKEKAKERQFRRISGLISERGLSVRRENLSRGNTFRVKSGLCTVGEENIIFVDKRLPVEQQNTVLIDYLVEMNWELSEEELTHLPDSARHILEAH
jgi:hypothetical protein